MWKASITVFLLIHCVLMVNSQTTWTCPTCEGFYAVPGTCGRDYYVCVMGSPYVTSCPPNTIFDPATLVCTDSELASCVFKCPSTEDGFYPTTTVECSNNYYTCVGGESFLSNCPGTSVFDPVSRMCVEKDKCKVSTTTPARTTTTSPTTRTTTPTPTTTPTTTRTTTRPTTTLRPFTCPATGNYESGPCSATYYLCVGSGTTPTIATCPPGQVFDPAIKYCEVPDKVSGCSNVFIDFAVSSYSKNSKLDCTARRLVGSNNKTAW